MAATPEPARPNPAPASDDPAAAVPVLAAAAGALNAELPARPVHTRTQLFRHIAIVTAGILIALSLENLVQWTRNRLLLHEARANLRDEIRQNQAKLADYVTQLDKYEKQRDVALQFANDLLTRQRTDITSISLEFGAQHLSSAAWQTAGITGALGHMRHAEVQKYAAVYDLQRRFDELTNEAVKDYPVLGESLPDDRNVRALEEWRARLQANRGALRLQRGYARSLADFYERALKP